MDHLSFTVHTPAHKGTYSLPTTQKLSDGDETDWNGRRCDVGAPCDRRGGRRAGHESTRTEKSLGKRFLTEAVGTTALPIRW